MGRNDRLMTNVTKITSDLKHASRKKKSEQKPSRYRTPLQLERKWSERERKIIVRGDARVPTTRMNHLFITARLRVVRRRVAEAWSSRKARSERQKVA